jgi:acyl carrier protein
MTLDNEELREALKRCSPATYYAACKFRQTRDVTQLPPIVVGVIERYVDREVRPKLRDNPEALRLREDLGLDSLTMMEVVMLAEEVLPISVSNEELITLRTIGDVQRFILKKLRDGPEERIAPITAPANRLAG